MSTLLARHRNIIDFALSSLLRRKAKNLSLLAVYTLIVVAIASAMLFINALKRQAAAVLKDAPDMMVQKMVAGRHDLMPVSRGEVIGGITGVRSVTPRLWGYYYDAVSGANYTLTVPDGPAACARGYLHRQRCGPAHALCRRGYHAASHLPGRASAAARGAGAAG